MTEILEYTVSIDNLPQIDMAFDCGKGYDALNELMRAIILRAVEDYNSPGELRTEAIAYMSGEEDDEDDEYIFSFAAICRHLGLDPSKTRHAIMTATRRISTRRRAA